MTFELIDDEGRILRLIDIEDLLEPLDLPCGDYRLRPVDRYDEEHPSDMDMPTDGPLFDSADLGRALVQVYGI